MSERASGNSEDIFLRWMQVEMGKINKAIVAQRKNLAQLMQEDRPSSRTKAGDDYIFERDALEELHTRLPQELHGKLRLPIIFFSDNRVPDSCYINDEYALRTLQTLGELSELRRMQQGKLWMGKSMAYSIMKKYPTIFQIAFG